MRAVIGLGANLGERAATLEAAVERLAATPGIVVLRRSTLRETEPVGGPAGQPRYLNGAVLLDSTLEPLPLLRVLLDIERALGRAREAETVRFGPRLVDLDLLLAGPHVLRTPELSLPHPRLRERIFALGPLVEVWPEARDPRDGSRLSDVLADLLCAARRPDTLGA